jgi:hypothetical protein
MSKKIRCLYDESRFFYTMIVLYFLCCLSFKYSACVCVCLYDDEEHVRKQEKRAGKIVMRKSVCHSETTTTTDTVR